MKIIGTIIKKLLQTLFLWLFGYLAISALHDKQWLWLCVFGYISIHLFGFLLGICHFKTKEERDANRASKKELKPPTISIHQIVTIGGKTVSKYAGRILKIPPGSIVPTGIPAPTKKVAVTISYSVNLIPNKKWSHETMSLPAY